MKRSAAATRLRPQPDLEPLEARTALLVGRIAIVLADVLGHPRAGGRQPVVDQGLPGPGKRSWIVDADADLHRLLAGTLVALDDVQLLGVRHADLVQRGALDDPHVVHHQGDGGQGLAVFHWGLALAMVLLAVHPDLQQRAAVAAFLQRMDGHAHFAVFAQTLDRIFIGIGGTSLPLDEEISYEHSRWQKDYPGARPDHKVFVVDHTGKVVEEWKLWNEMIQWLHRIRSNPDDPEEHVWSIDRTSQ